MNWDQIEGKWTQFKGKARQQWGKLTDSDLDVAAGNRDRLRGMIQEKYGIAKEEAERQIDAWLRGISGAGEAAKESAEAVEATYEQLQEQVETLKADMAALGTAAREAGYASAREAVANARRAGRAAVKVAEGGYDYAGAQMEDAVTKAGRFTRERPAAALGLAAGMGALVALLFSRR